MYIYESLPEYSQENRNVAKKRDMITSTNNCDVSVPIHDGNVSTKIVKIRGQCQVDEFILNALKNDNLTSCSGNEIRLKSNVIVLGDTERQTKSTTRLERTPLFLF